MTDNKTMDRMIFCGPMQPWDALQASGEHEGSTTAWRTSWLTTPGAALCR